MLENEHLERVNQMFADQFESNGDGFLYRRSMKDAPIQVSSAEQGQFLSDFKNSYRKVFWIAVASLVSCVMSYIIWATFNDIEISNIELYSGLAIYLAGFVIVHRRVWNAPARFLERRPAIGRQRTRAEVITAMIERTTWGQLGLGAVGMVVLLLEVASKDDLLRGWNRLWLVSAGLVFSALVIQVYRKWRSGKKRN
jgi:hypothetical protein